jgi:hypothetical protein
MNRDHTYIYDEEGWKHDTSTTFFTSEPSNEIGPMMIFVPYAPHGKFFYARWWAWILVGLGFLVGAVIGRLVL